MTDRKLVLFFFFVVALGLNALNVSVPFAHSPGTHSTYVSGHTKVGTPSDVSHGKVKVHMLHSEGKLASGEVPLLIRKIFSHYRFLSGINHQKDLFLPIMCQGPPVA